MFPEKNGIVNVRPKDLKPFKTRPSIEVEPKKDSDVRDAEVKVQSVSAEWTKIGGVSVTNRFVHTKIAPQMRRRQLW